MHYHGDYLPRLAGHGAPVGPDRVVTSARASALYVRDEMPGVRRVLAVGASGLERELREAGLDVVTAGYAATRMSQEGIDGWEAAGHPDAVVVGLDPQLTYLRIAAAADCIRAGAVLVATNRDPIYPTERGLPARRGCRGGGDRDGLADDRQGHDRQARAVPAARGGPSRRGGRRGRRDDRRCPDRRGRGSCRGRPDGADAHRRDDPGDGRRPPARRAPDAHRRGRRAPRGPSSPSSPRTPRETSSAIGAS